MDIEYTCMVSTHTADHGRGQSLRSRVLTGSSGFSGVVSMSHFWASSASSGLSTTALTCPWAFL
ncbi:MAG: hypothetical protein ACXAEN_26565, partial [Candidatus Thorarchaeota archaeon]